MTLKRISLGFLLFSLFGSLLAILILSFDLPWNLPLTPIITLSSFLFTVLHGVQREGWRKMFLLVVLVIASGLFFESLGVATGLVYGPYHYTDQLGPKFLGLVPWLIPVAWTFMIYPSMVIAQRLAPANMTGFKRGLLVAALSGVIMTAWDVVMDPMMVQGGNWVWEVQGGYFGVPLQNFWGWWLTTFTAVGLFLIFSRKMPNQGNPLPDRWAIYLYTMTGCSSVATSLIVGLSGSALAGIFAMLPWVVMGWWLTRQNESKAINRE